MPAQHAAHHRRVGAAHLCDRRGRSGVLFDHRDCPDGQPHRGRPVPAVRLLHGHVYGGRVRAVVVVRGPAAVAALLHSLHLKTPPPAHPAPYVLRCGASCSANSARLVARVRGMGFLRKGQGGSLDKCDSKVRIPGLPRRPAGEPSCIPPG
eukprot:331161-Chlamydomonas_euryale.AAC.7